MRRSKPLDCGGLTRLLEHPAAHVLACTLIPVAVFGILLFTEGKSVMETYQIGRAHV